MSWLVGDFETDRGAGRCLLSARKLTVDSSQTRGRILIYEDSELDGRIMELTPDQAERLRELLGLSLWYLDGETRGP